jgi:addiction module HigA family antidote
MPYPAIDNLPPVHPGEMLRDELEALRLSARKFADHIGVAPNAVTVILNGDRGISAEMALRLGRVFGTSEQYWMNLQSLYEAKKARATTNVEAITRLVVEAAD